MLRDPTAFGPRVRCWMVCFRVTDCSGVSDEVKWFLHESERLFVRKGLPSTGLVENNDSQLSDALSLIAIAHNHTGLTDPHCS